jgi:hypothetical protein
VLVPSQMISRSSLNYMQYDAVAVMCLGSAAQAWKVLPAVNQTTPGFYLHTAALLMSPLTHMILSIFIAPTLDAIPPP